MESRSRILRHFAVTIVASEAFANSNPIIFVTERRGHQYFVATDFEFHFMRQPKRSRSLYIGWERNGRPQVNRVERRIDYRDLTHLNYRACPHR